MAKKAEKELSPEEKLAQTIVLKEEQPYEVPENWVWVRLLKGFAECLDSFRKPVNATERLNRIGNIPYYGATGQVGWIDDYLTNDHLILVGEDGAPFLDLLKNKAYIIDGKAWVNNHAHVLKAFYGKQGNIYLMHYLNVFDFNGYVNGTTRLKLTQNKLAEIPIPLPPLAEQKRIVQRIESLFDKLNQAKGLTQAALDSFETRKAAILHKAFTGELTAKWREDNGVGVDSWEKIIFDKCFETMQNGISKRSGKSGMPKVVLRLANIKENYIINHDLREIILDDKECERYELFRNDILIIRVNGSKENVGKFILIDNDYKWTFCDHLIRGRLNQQIILPKFLIFISQGYLYKKFVSENMVSSAGQNTISQKSLALFSFRAPKVNEQKEIVRILDKLFTKEEKAKELCEQALEKIDLIKKSILARAFRGELGTNDPNEESALNLLKEII